MPPVFRRADPACGAGERGNATRLLRPRRASLGGGRRSSRSLGRLYGPGRHHPRLAHARRPAFHTLPYEELLDRLRAVTNLRVVPDEQSATGYRIEIGPFPGWAEVPEW